MRSWTAALLLPLTLVACAPEEDDESYDATLLEQYRTALPSADRLESGVPTPGSQPGALALGVDSEIAALAIEAAVAINEPVAELVATLEAISTLPPTLYDSTTREFLWGPWPNEDGVGNVLAYIRENEPGADFQYSYAFARLMGDDVASAAPIVAGGASPDAVDPDLGVGVTLWDMDLNNAFDETHDPDFDANRQRSRGRVAILYGADTEGDGEFYFDVAVLRDFVGEDSEKDAPPADAELLYGHTKTDGVARHFLDWVIEGDLCDATAESCFESNVVDDRDETLAFRAAFLGTAGRGEARLSGGDLSTNVNVVECWNAMLQTTYFAVGDDTRTFEEGACTGKEGVSLADGGVPTLDQIDTDLIDALDCVASKGYRACEQ